MAQTSPSETEMVRESVKAKHCDDPAEQKSIARKNFAIASKKFRQSMIELQRAESQVFTHPHGYLDVSDMDFSLGRFKILEPILSIVSAFNLKRESLKPFYFLIEKAAGDTGMTPDLLAFTCFLLFQLKPGDIQMNKTIQAFIFQLRDAHSIFFFIDAIIAMNTFSETAEIKIRGECLYGLHTFSKNRHDKFRKTTLATCAFLDDFGSIESYLFLFNNSDELHAHFTKFCDKIDPTIV